MKRTRVWKIGGIEQGVIWENENVQPDSGRILCVDSLGRFRIVWVDATLSAYDPYGRAGALVEIVG